MERFRTDHLFRPVHVVIETRERSALRRFESVAPADGTDAEVQGGMFRVAAFVDHRFRGFVLFSDLNQLMLARVVLSKVGAKTALSFLDVLHGLLRLQCER